MFKILNDSFGDDKSKVKVLEIGSRVLGENSRNGKMFFPDMDYTGFDYHDGPNVDVVGDAHKLSSYFKEDEKFDIVVSVAVFEHLAMPWKVAEEIFKVLKPGGYVYICTHFAWGIHERPWHFFHFTDMGLKVLFNETLGFKCLESGFADLLVVKFSKFASEERRNKPMPGLYGGVQYFGQKIKDKLDYDWNAMTVDKVLPNTEYPTPTYNK
ncbi:class I SAM-dependent methyltransferase [Brachyspira hyodysenteriae]|uniref:class I SAM-dependent methyltransferase n=1 Tax=Brachyspira hyodysenteriae TaxID=159 RepID=UPI0032220EA7